MATDDVSRDKLFDILSSRRRRYALHACRAGETPLSLSELAEQVAAWEYGKDPAELTAEERRRVYTSLQQTHLPAMEGAGILQVDGKQIALAEGAGAFEVYLEVVPEGSIPWGVYYLGLSVVAGGLLAAVAAGIYPDWIPDLAWAALIVAVFGASAAVHIVRERQSRLGRGDRPPELEGP